MVLETRSLDPARHALTALGALGITGRVTCVRICMYTCAHIHIHTYVSRCSYPYNGVLVYGCMCVQINTHMLACVRARSRSRASVLACVRACVCVFEIQICSDSVRECGSETESESERGSEISP